MTVPSAARDTIVAIATAAGRGGIGVLRLSGERVPMLACGFLASGRLPESHRAVLEDFLDEHGESIDRGIALYFEAPRSYTGEHVLELQAHGSMVVLQELLRRACALGARPARAGEFTERAYLNGRLDLAQAEAVADLIEASTLQAARSAQQSLRGVFSQRIEASVNLLRELRVLVEASLDFPEEDIDVLAESDVCNRLQSLMAQLEQTLLAARQGQRLRDGVRLVLAGHPNVGKSSLLNALAGSDTAIVTDVPGTTRDVVRERFEIDGLSFELADTAGLRSSDDPVERIGIERAHAELAQADLILRVHDARLGTVEEPTWSLPYRPTLGVIDVYNKVDLCKAAATAGESGVWLSAKTGEGLDALRQLMLERAGLSDPTDAQFSARERHVLAIERCLLRVDAARDALEHHAGAELAAEELRDAQLMLHEIIGVETADDLLGRIFSTFCIGK
ncbi:MAG: tRNA uridine-5-carboxymethylaminomethyl(34) synthesis GTPase MnmE [Gammaproteobacteria bacterium]|nr:tRNA uridine-5-carboxymethylaminomethyl(34) synthesis GTPase MnmE [Gammaproteobacteria bacterium]